MTWQINFQKTQVLQWCESHWPPREDRPVKRLSPDFHSLCPHWVPLWRAVCGFRPAADYWGGCRLIGSSPLLFSLTKKKKVCVLRKITCHYKMGISRNVVLFLCTWFYIKRRFKITDGEQSFHSLCWSICTVLGDIVLHLICVLSTVAAILTQKNEFIWPLSAALFAFGREGLNDSLEVSFFGNDHYLSVRHGGVIHDTNPVGEALTSWCQVGNFLSARRSRLALRFSWWAVILLKR